MNDIVKDVDLSERQKDQWLIVLSVGCYFFDRRGNIWAMMSEVERDQLELCLMWGRGKPRGTKHQGKCKGETVRPAMSKRAGKSECDV